MYNALAKRLSGAYVSFDTCQGTDVVLDGSFDSTSLRLIADAMDNRATGIAMVAAAKVSCNKCKAEVSSMANLFRDVEGVPFCGNCAKAMLTQ